MILKNLLRRKARTLLTILAISMGVMAIIALGSMAVGIDEGYGSMISGSKADLILHQPNTVDVSLSTVDEEVGERLEAMPEIDKISAMVEGYVPTDASPYVFIFGYPADSFLLDRFQIIEGVSFNDPLARRKSGKPLLLGSAAAESFKKDVGDTIRMGNSVYRIIGIYQTGDAFEDGGAVIELSEAQVLLGKSRQVSLFYIKLKDPSLKEQLIDRAAKVWPKYVVSGTSDFADSQMMGDMMYVFVWMIAGLAILLGGIGMMNAQLMSVYDRTREIGVLRAVGWKSWRVLMMILGESIVVCFLGGIIGLAIAWGLLWMIEQNTVMMGMGTSSIRPNLIVNAFVTVLLMGIVGGLYPAYRAAKLAPIEALRYEGGTTGKSVKRLPFGGLPVQNLWQRAARTFLTLLVIAVTVGAIMSLEAMVEGMSEQLSGMAAGQGAEIMVRQADIADTSLSAIDARDGAKIAAMSEVESVSGMVFTAIMTDDGAGFMIILGYAPNEYAIQRFNVVEGELITGNHQIMLGSMLAESLHKSVGETIELNGSRFKVKGIYESGVGWEESGAVISLRDGQNFLGRPHKSTMYSVNLVDPKKAEQMVEKINEEIPNVHAALSGEFADQMPDMESMDSMMGGISFLAILVGGLGVMNTMLMSVLERTREIGVLRALGWRRRRVLEMIIKESLILSLVGAVGGVFVAFGLGALMRANPMTGELLNMIWTVGIFARAILVSLMLGLVGGIYPAYRATKMQPVEALRYE
ncbi:MAG: ABC transporter permease [Anaerolineaceae bacterium]|nr:ABC transporter permease [Anaerolineaceae bacterium]